MHRPSPYPNPALRRAPAPHLLPSFIGSVEDIRGVRILRLRGPVGMQVRRQEREALEASEADAGAFQRPLLLDFGATTAWDTTTVASLIQAVRRRLAARTKVALVNAPPGLLGLLEISRVRDMFPIYSSEAEALNDLAHPTNLSRAIP